MRSGHRGEGEVPAIVPGTARGEPGVRRRPSLPHGGQGHSDTPGVSECPGRALSKRRRHRGGKGREGTRRGPPGAAPSPGRHRLPLAPSPLRQVPANCTAGRPRAAPGPTPAPSGAFPQKPPNFLPKESRGARRAGHGVGTSGPPEPLPAALPAIHRRTIHPRTCPSIFPVVPAAAGEARGRPRSGSASPQSRPGWRGGSAVRLRSAPLLPRAGSPRPPPPLSGEGRGTRLPETASLPSLSPSPRQRRVSVAWCRSSACGHVPLQVLQPPGIPTHQRGSYNFSSERWKMYPSPIICPPQMSQVHTLGNERRRFLF